MTRYTILAALVAALALSGCKDDQKYSDADRCAGELIEVEGDAYCVFIEEGFLAEDCPQAFPFGHEIGGVIVCSEEEDVDDDKIQEELDRRDLGDNPCASDADCADGQVCTDGACVPEGPQCQADAECADGFVCVNEACQPAVQECVADEDCPQPIPFIGCEGSIAVQIFASGGCVDGQCDITGEETRRDCAEDGLECVDGECVGDMECVDMDDCDNREGYLYCEGDSVWEDFGSYSDCFDGQCVPAPGLPPMEIENCADSGQACFEGACVPQGGECTEDIECAIDGAYITCEGPFATLVAVEGSCGEQNRCIEVETRERTDCQEMGQFCSEGSCVDPGGACQTADDCPQPDQEPWCDGNVAVTPPGDTAECNGGVCTIVGEPVLPMRQDCDEVGTMCRNGSCG